ncbi:MAG: hypothetical protein ACJ798_02030 [Phenylobacterium sp.]
MRVLFALAAAAALTLAGCDAIQNPFAAKSAKPAAPAPPAPVQSATAPSPPEPAAPAAAPEAVAVPAAAQTAAATPPPPVEVVHWARADYPQRERRLEALIANAETRDTLGDTHRVVAEADQRRARCATRSCIERAYAEEEAWLRQWEGSASIR